MASIFAKLRLRAFLHGMGSVLCLMPSAREQADDQPARIGSFADDARAIARDFSAVGCDLSTAVAQYRTEVETHQPMIQLDLFASDRHGQ